jgi:hypothetical protein
MSAAQNNKIEAVTLAQMQELGTGKLANLAGPGWLDTSAIAMFAAAPGTTRAIPVDLRAWPRSSTLASLAGTPGGGAVPQGSVNNFFTMDSFVANPRVAPWAVIFRAELYIPQANNFFFMGIGLGDVDFYAIVQQPHTGGGDTKAGLLQYVGSSPTYTYGTGPVLGDGALHEWMLAGDTVNVTAYYDGVAFASAPLSAAHGPAAACKVFAKGSSSHWCYITDMAYAF